ncbi:CLUMA_CG000072, isoform A [Clunio marinus]|uniref:CLUMA_CG000072, isoform A n=1 Tax=Clunio marinus TaxID=568069 RepID=A0A1J1HG03_9DIPT|nr:CLUMA_CG000072, isoform A [Clunio marinus]
MAKIHSSFHHFIFTLFRRRFRTKAKENYALMKPQNEHSKERMPVRKLNNKPRNHRDYHVSRKIKPNRISLRNFRSRKGIKISDITFPPQTSNALLAR